MVGREWVYSREPVGRANLELMVAEPSRLEARSIAVEASMEVLDLRPALSSAAECPYQPANMHGTEYGHEVVAEAVARHLAIP